jgi:hypothetical protein
MSTKRIFSIHTFPKNRSTVDHIVRVVWIIQAMYAAVNYTAAFPNELHGVALVTIMAVFEGI